jgi:hypothetical protein
MNENSIKRRNAISQCLSLLPTDGFACPLLNDEYDKLNVDSLFQIFVAAQIANCGSYKTIEKMIRADKTYRNSLNLQSISGSQLSRRIKDLPAEWAQAFFFQVALMLEELTREEKGITPRIGRLKIIDSTHLKLPPNLCDWAYVT